MAMIYELDGVAPQIDASCFLAPDAVVVGAVTVAAEASIWFGAVVRADTEQITIGMGSNVQENAVLHADPGFPQATNDLEQPLHIVLRQRTCGFIK